MSLHIRLLSESVFIKTQHVQFVKIINLRAIVSRLLKTYILADGKLYLVNL